MRILKLKSTMYFFWVNINNQKHVHITKNFFLHTENKAFLKPIKIELT